MSRHLLLQACAVHKLRVHFGDISSASLQTSASEEHQELTIKAPPEVGYLLSDSEAKPICAFDEIVLWTHVSTPCVVTQKLSQLGWKPMSSDQCLWCRYYEDGELKGVIGIHVGDFLIGLEHGETCEKWMSEIVFVSLGILEGFGI